MDPTCLRHNLTLHSRIDNPRDQGNPTKPFALPRRITIHASPKALYIKPDRQRLPAKSLIRIEWSPHPTLVIIHDQPTIEHELRTIPNLTLEFDGIVGIIQLFHDSYLILISSHSTVAKFNGKKVHRIERVLALPLVYTKAIDLLTNELARRPTKRRKSISLTSISTSPEGESSDSDTTDDSEDEDLTPPEADEDLPQECLSLSSSSVSLSSSVDDGFQKIVDPNKINLSRLLWKPKLNKNSSLDPSLSYDKPVQTSLEDHNQDNLIARLTLDKRFISVLCNELTRGGMFYALDWDVTHNFQTQSDLSLEPELYDAIGVREPKMLEPLHKRAQRRFWWNQMMIEPFIKSGFDNLGYVIMQGFVESTKVKMSNKPNNHQTLEGLKKGSPETAEKPDERSPKQEEDDDAVDMIEIGLISRRSTLRPGLRYQRRGIDLHGSVANSVESECVMMTHDRSKSPSGTALLWSFIQVRGSIPLFWGQNPSALRPPIVLEGSDVENLDAMKKHFSNLISLYGNILVICLAEKAGHESKLVHEFESKFKTAKDQMIKSEVDYNDLPDRISSHKTEHLNFIGWDFHQQCKGMHYENVMKLIHDIQDPINQFGYFSSQGGRQKGVIRSNCIDCLDRTNVIQSAIARQILNRFLNHLNLPINSEDGNDSLDIAFNSLWANNGDQISKQYAGTSALKGDFVRTGRRNWKGVVNDATNSVARMWHNSISDFFKQSVLDYVLGVNVSNYSQFQQSYSTFNDPSDLFRISKIRSIAIDDAAKQVLSGEEIKVNGWFFLTPSDPNSIKSIPLGLEERIFILSSTAIYIVNYEYVLSEVQEFLRIGFEDIISLQIGVYITSATDDRDRDLKENFGFVISYDTTGATEKKNTYSMRLEGNKPSQMNCGNELEDERLPEHDDKPSATIKQIALKALKNLTVDSFKAPTSMGDDRDQDESRSPMIRITGEEFVRKVIKEIEVQSNKNQIIFMDENLMNDEVERDDDQDQFKLRRLILINNQPIINLDEFFSLMSIENQVTQFNSLLARMTRGVKHIIGHERNQNLTG